MLISQLDAQGSTWYKTVDRDSFGHSLRLKTSSYPTTHHDGYEDLESIRQAPRQQAPFQQSLRPDSAPQHQTPGST